MDASKSKQGKMMSLAASVLNVFNNANTREATLLYFVCCSNPKLKEVTEIIKEIFDDKIDTSLATEDPDFNKELDAMLAELKEYKDSQHK